MFRLSIYRTALIMSCGLVAACAERPLAVAPAAPLAAAKPIYLVVERGQSLDRIAQTYRVAKNDIIAANQLKPPFRLKPGTILAIPVSLTEAAKPAATRQSLDMPLHAVAKPDRATSASAPVQRKKPKALKQAVIPLDDTTPAQSSAKKSLSSRQEVIPLDDPAPAQRATNNSSPSPVGASSDAAGPRILFPGPAPKADERPPKP